MKEIIDYIVRHMVDSPDDVDVQEKEEDGVVTVELRVASDDMGKVIGRQGRTVRAMRTILSTVAAREGKKSRLDVLE